jgi:hypothetical protein
LDLRRLLTKKVNRYRNAPKTVSLPLLVQQFGTAGAGVPYEKIAQPIPFETVFS